ncbi:hypothetical protein L1887_31770 [Cichorium endivia]|nr:hypothetical protein L1887_31770 [Cichorium endivia]
MVAGRERKREGFCSLDNNAKCIWYLSVLTEMLTLVDPKKSTERANANEKENDMVIEDTQERITMQPEGNLEVRTEIIMFSDPIF